MSATVLVPVRRSLATVTATRDSPVPSFAIGNRATGDRVRAAIINAGFAVPTGTVRVDAPDAHGIDLAVALAVLLADPAHVHLRQPNLVAFGGLALDGTATPTDPPDIEDLPPGPWVARFWRPTDHIPEPGEDAVLTMTEVATLAIAWDVLVKLLEIERRLAGERTTI